MFVSYFSKIHPDAILPERQTKQSAGYDLHIIEDIIIEPGKVLLARTGLIAQPPIGFHWEIVLRSSTAVKNPGISLANHVGIIDADYCGPQDELKIALANWSDQSYSFSKGDRLAQLLLVETFCPEIIERPLEVLVDKDSRKGFGSTGA